MGYKKELIFASWTVACACTIPTADTLPGLYLDVFDGYGLLLATHRWLLITKPEGC